MRDMLDLYPDQAKTDTAVIVLGDWIYAGRGYLDNFTAAQAVRSAILARSRD